MPTCVTYSCANHVQTYGTCAACQQLEAINRQSEQQDVAVEKLVAAAEEQARAISRQTEAIESAERRAREREEAAKLIERLKFSCGWCSNRYTVTVVNDCHEALRRHQQKTQSHWEIILDEYEQKVALVRKEIDCQISALKSTLDQNQFCSPKCSHDFRDSPPERYHSRNSEIVDSICSGLTEFSGQLEQLVTAALASELEARNRVHRETLPRGCTVPAVSAAVVALCAGPIIGAINDGWVGFGFGCLQAAAVGLALAVVIEPLRGIKGAVYDTWLMGNARGSEIEDRKRAFVITTYTLIVVIAASIWAILGYL